MADETAGAGKKGLFKCVGVNPGEPASQECCENGQQKCWISDISTAAAIVEYKEKTTTLWPSYDTKQKE